jgi:hypothetical protein
VVSGHAKHGSRGVQGAPAQAHPSNTARQVQIGAIGAGVAPLARKSLSRRSKASRTAPPPALAAVVLGGLGGEQSKDMYGRLASYNKMLLRLILWLRRQP